MQVESTVQHELPQKVAIRAKKSRIPKPFAWINEISSHFGYPDENVAAKRMVEAVNHKGGGAVAR